jgi:hypothetical protein
MIPSTKIQPDKATTDSLNLPPFQILRLRISVRFRYPPDLPDQLIANILRGGLGLTMRHLVCPQQWMDRACPSCPLYANCVYGQIFQSTPPADSQRLSLQQDAPRPFVVVPPELEDADADPRMLRFGLTLFGTAVHSLAYWCTTLQRLGAVGLGRERTRFEVVSVEACHPQATEQLFHPATAQTTLPSALITNAELFQKCIANQLEQPPVIRIAFPTPLLLRSGSGIAARGQYQRAAEVRERPPLGILVRRLRDRFSSLSAFFGQPWETDFARLAQVADAVPIEQSHTSWLSRSRRSTRTGQSHELSGLVGWTTYRFASRDEFSYLEPLLRLGEWLHVGKNAVWGNGAIRITVVGEHNQ